MRSLIAKTIAVSAGLALSLGTANAATISATYAVVGSNFSSTAASPYTSITESFTVTFDSATLVSGQTTGISLNPSTITPTSALAYSYVPFADTLIVGGTAGTVTTADPTTTDFAVVIRDATKGASFSITSLSYTVGTGVTYTASTVAKAAAVPEPLSLALLGTVTGTLVLLRRRRPKI